ncbi:MAG: restriction endonuclease subunit S [Mycoplasmataceae bacterium]|nr:restriction endonuclease subunit S [Mycoplasmataceae bacterium]
MNKLLEFNKNEVNYFKLNEICEIKRGERITKKDLIQNGYPVMSGGKTFFGYYHKYNRNENTITIAQYGTAGYVNWISEKFWANDVCYCLFPNEKILNNKFLYYVLKNKQEQIYEDVIEATPAHYPIEALKNIVIPLPPIEIQNEIVNILDQFNDLTNSISLGLPKEIELRKQQYEYYRNKLLTFKELEK